MSLWSAKNLATRETWHSVKQDCTTQVYRVTYDDRSDVIVKQFTISGPAKKIRFIARYRRLKAFYNDISLTLPDLLGGGTDGASGLGELVYRCAPGVDLRKLEPKDLSVEEWGVLFNQVGSLLCSLHGKGWVHGDFKFGNLLFDKQLEIESSTLYLIDLESVSHPLFGVSSKKARDIARFLINAMEKACPYSAMTVFFESATKQLMPIELTEIKNNVLFWLEKFSERHQKKYGVEQNITSLKFLR